MITTLDPGRAHRTLNVEDNIVFSKVWDKKGFPVDLKMCLMGQSGNAEMRAAAGIDDEPITILHGDADGVVPLEISQRFYISLVRAGLEKQSDLFIVHNGGHGTREFFQPETQQVILAQLRKYLGRAAD